MVKDAESQAEEDRQRRERIDAKNMADSLTYQAEKQLQDLGDKVPEAGKSRVEELIKELREASNQENVDRMKSLTNDLQQALMQIGSTVYSQAQGAAEAGSADASSASDSNDVIDADFVTQ